MPLANGETFAGFTIRRLLGSGGTGGVYLAESRRDGGTVALKILRADVSGDTDFRTRFQRDLDVATNLEHYNVAHVVDFGEYDRRLWVATDYVEGRDCGLLLAHRYSEGMPLESVAVIVDDVAHALDRAHEGGLLHLHVKPANVLIDDPFSKSYRILLTDFGTARRLGDLDALSSAATAALVGHAAPEQFTGGPVDGRADQYALAATAFHLLTGHAPFDHPDPAVVASRHRNATPAALTDSHPALAALDPVLRRAMAKDPAARYPTCREFAAALAHPPAQRAAAPAPATADIAAPAAAGTAPRPTQLDHAEPPGAGSVAAGKPADLTDTAPPARRAFRDSTVLQAVVAIVVVGLLTVVGFLLGGTASKPPASTRQPGSAAASALAPSTVPAWPACSAMTAAIAAMPLRDKLAQLLMVGVTGAADARSVVDDQHVGGLMIGSWTDRSMLSDGSLKQIAAGSGPLPLAVSVDEEGGRVQRLASIIGTQDSPRVLAQTRSAAEVHDIAVKRGLAMKELGITIDFAPVVDVTDEADDEVIGDRSFGDDPAKVIEYAGAYAQGLRDAGLLPVLKHFPGHGHGSGDSHEGGVSTPPLDALKGDDLIPYQSLTTQPPVAVMVGHLQVPGLTGTDPASLSPAAYSLLRSGDYGGRPFDGLVFTDDLSSMAAINQRYGVADAVLLALRAGADVALWITTDQVPAVLDRLEQAVTAGDLPQSRVDDALRHVAAAKGTQRTCAG
jgi:beta-glucosidase-like glycosyl hydrolase